MRKRDRQCLLIAGYDGPVDLVKSHVATMQGVAGIIGRNQIFFALQRKARTRYAVGDAPYGRTEIMQMRHIGVQRIKASYYIRKPALCIGHIDRL